MPLRPVFDDVKPVTISLDALFLDPNNPRFATSKGRTVPDSRITDEAIQDATESRLVDEFEVNRLRLNMQVNGYLPLDRVVVREFTAGKYVVLEGNRRICAAKILKRVAAEGKLNLEIQRSIKDIPCLVYTGSNPQAAWLFQGIRHITGFVEWSSFHKAKLLVEQMEEEGLNLSDAGSRFGLTPHGAGQWVRGYYAFQQALDESDYGDHIDERLYPFIQELFSRSSGPLRDWLGWHEERRVFADSLRLNEFLSWFYASGEDGETKGQWESRAIDKRDDLRNIAWMLTKAPKFFEEFRQDRDVERAYSTARASEYEAELEKTADPISELFETLAQFRKQLDNVPLRLTKDQDKWRQFKSDLGELRALIDGLPA